MEGVGCAEQGRALIPCPELLVSHCWDRTLQSPRFSFALPKASVLFPAGLRDRFGSSFPSMGKEAVLLSQVTLAPADGMKPMVCSRHAYPRWLAAGDFHMQEKQADFQAIQGWR